ncbi:DUF3515 domain-containing protein [Nocardioides sp. cx-169]|uniref:DUF3515 domain-containing protein n=1 Tax=Nocardioides sp. cx-169 TaxID=2899080 RepID=UPI0022AC17F0|nr:DUF3515 domain-containing protein [Nocardioides sp. cx-169]
MSTFDRRPGPRGVRGVVAFASAVLLAGALTSCGAPEIESVDLDEADTAACRDLLAALPERVAGHDRVDVEPEDALGAAWGDPALVLTCGAEEPAYDETWQCEVALGVGWLAPPDLLEADQQDEDITVWAVSHDPLVSLEIPSDYRPDGVAEALADLAGPVSDSLDEADATCL